MKTISLFFVALIILQFSHAQNVGIGTTTPGFPLNFSNALGDKISLYGNSGNHYGLGIQSGLLQVHSDLAVSNISFGYGSSTNFTERMRVINSGADGLSLNGRLLLRNGSLPLDINAGPGVWLNKADNSGLLGFMGTQNNQNIGFYGGPDGWGFTYNAINSRVGIGNANPATRLDVGGLNNWDLVNTEGDFRVGNSAYRIKLGIALGGGGAGAAGIMQSGGVGTFNLGAGNKNLIQLNGPANSIDLLNLTGGLRINGNAGAAGQVLKSNGTGASPSWGSGFDLYNNTEEIGATGIVTITEQTAADIPGLSKTITIATPAKVIVEFNLGVDAPSCAFCGISTIDCIIMLNGGVTNRIRYEIPNDTYTTVTGKRVLSLGPGTYTFSLRINNLTGPAVRAGYYSTYYTSYLFVQTIPQ